MANQNGKAPAQAIGGQYQQSFGDSASSGVTGNPNAQQQQGYMGGENQVASSGQNTFGPQGAYGAASTGSGYQQAIGGTASSGVTGNPNAQRQSGYLGGENQLASSGQNTYGPQGAFGAPSTGSGYQQATQGALGGMAGGMESGNPTQGNALGDVNQPFSPTSNQPFAGMTQTQQTPTPGSSNYSYGMSSSGGGQNPYLSQVAQGIQDNANRNLNEQIMPNIGTSANAAGGYGGARHGIAQGLAASRSTQDTAGAIANMYSNAYEGDQNRNVQMAGIGSNYGLGMRGLDLQGENMNNNFYTAQRGQDLSQLGLGASLLGQGNAAAIGQGQGIYGVGQNEQYAPSQWLNANYGPLMGGATAGSTQSGTQQQFYNPTMQWLGTIGQAAGSAAMFSDVRLKENIKPVGQTFDGLTTYIYNYKGDDKPQMGVMAQEVAMKKPEALGPTVGGLLTVRYGML